HRSVRSCVCKRYAPPCDSTIERQIETLNSALFGDRVISLFDRGDLLCRDEDELLWQTTRHKLVWLAFGDQFTVLAPQLVIADGRFSGAHRVGGAVGSS